MNNWFYSTYNPWSAWRLLFLTRTSFFHLGDVPVKIDTMGISSDAEEVSFVKGDVIFKQGDEGAVCWLSGYVLDMIWTYLDRVGQ